MKIKQGGRVKLALSIVVCVGLSWAAGPELERARKLYNPTEFQQSLQVLQAVPNKDAAVYALMGRDYYMQGEFKKATEVAGKSDSSGTWQLRLYPVAGPRLWPARRDLQYDYGAGFRQQGAPVF